jgi:uncharacterized protein YndB with AHSA1/START domain
MNGIATVTVERRLGAAPERVFDAWVEPEQAGRWLFRTPGGTLERCEIDARAGGGFTIVERRGGDPAEHFGEFVELDRPRRIAFDFWTSFSADRTRVTVAIVHDGDGSTVTLTHEGVWSDYEAVTRKGWSKLVESLDRTLAGG